MNILKIVIFHQRFLNFLFRAKLSLRFPLLCVSKGNLSKSLAQDEKLRNHSWKIKIFNMFIYSLKLLTKSPSTPNISLIGTKSRWWRLYKNTSGKKLGFDALTTVKTHVLLMYCMSLCMIVDACIDTCNTWVKHVFSLLELFGDMRGIFNQLVLED